VFVPSLSWQNYRFQISQKFKSRSVFFFLRTQPSDSTTDSHICEPNSPREPQLSSLPRGIPDGQFEKGSNGIASR
jgi:hypothetical protein